MILYLKPIARHSEAMKRLLVIAGLIAGLAGGGAPAVAEPITLSGITFSDERGGFVIVDGWGSGTREDPFVIVERVETSGPAVLVVRGFSLRFGNQVRTNHLAGFALTKVVVNDTASLWQTYTLELQEELGQDSTYGDGLSFGQMRGQMVPFDSDAYADLNRVEEPLDGLRFSDGLVRPGAQVTFRFVITDMSPTPEFYIVQQRQTPVATLPGEVWPPS